MNTAAVPIESENLTRPQKRILIVDDDPATLHTVKTALSMRDYAVTAVSNGLEAVREAKAQPFELIILDACMPLMSGFEACEKIRTLQAYQQTPIFIATGLKDEESIDRAFAVGADDFIAKPVNLRVLSKRIDVLFNQETANSDKSMNRKLEQTLEKISDFTISVDMNGYFTRQSARECPEGLADLIAFTGNLQDLLKISDTHCSSLFTDLRRDKSIQNSESFTITHHNKNADYRFKMQIFRTQPDTFTLVVHDESEAYRSQKHAYDLLNYDDETQLPNQELLNLYLRKLDLSNIVNLEAFGIAYLRFENLQNLHSLLGKSRTLNHLQNSLFVINNIIATSRRSIQLYRHQYDEFIITYENCSKEQLYTLIEKISESFQLFDEKSKNITLQLNIGVCHGSTSHVSATEMRDLAKLAIGNQSGNFGVHYYSDKVQEKLDTHSRIERLMIRDINRRALEVHFQPKFSVDDLELCGMEALLRWNSAEMGYVAPGKFLPLAESLNLMNKISLLVIDKVFRQMSEWKANKRTQVPVSINVDASNLEQNSVVDALINSMLHYDISPELIELEVTESVMVQAHSGAMKNLHRLRQFGIKIAVDDFGTGYSSFHYLQDLPLDVLKIDMSFIRKVDIDKKTEAIVNAIINVGHELGLHVIAEGVESVSQLNKLKVLGCDSIQGYLTGKPVCAEKFPAFYDGAQIAGM